MKKRIGNDIQFSWHIYRKSGETQTPESFDGKDVEVKLISPLRQPVTIEDVTIATGVVTFTFRGKHQVTLGNYVAILQENRGEDGMVTLDVVDAVTLVAHSYMEEDGDDGDVIEASSVELTSTISAGGGIEQQQADWAQTDTSAVDYIKNKPSIYDKNEIDDKLDKCAKLDNNNPYELDIWSCYTASNGPSYQPDLLYVDGHQVIITSGINNYEVQLNTHGLELKDPTGTVTISADSWRAKVDRDELLKFARLDESNEHDSGTYDEWTNTTGGYTYTAKILGDHITLTKLGEDGCVMQIYPDRIRFMGSDSPNPITGETWEYVLSAAYTQPDWEEADPSSHGYILNKPDLSDYVTSSTLATALADYATQEWVEGKGYLTEHQDISGKENVTSIVEVASGTTNIQAAVDTYYNIAGEVTTLGVTLPEVTDVTKAAKVVLRFTTSSSFSAITITSASSATVLQTDGFAIEASKTYEVNALWNGTDWVVAQLIIE